MMTGRVFARPAVFPIIVQEFARPSKATGIVVVRALVFAGRPVTGSFMRENEIDFDRILCREEVRTLVEQNLRAIRKLPAHYISLYHGTKDVVLNSLELKADDCFDSKDEANLVLSCMLSSSFLAAHFITRGSSQNAKDVRAAFIKATCGLVGNAAAVYELCEEKWLTRVEDLVGIYGHPRGCLFLVVLCLIPMTTWFWL